MVGSQALSKGEMHTILQGVRWETYQALVLDLAETSGQRLTYDQGTLEIMTPYNGDGAILDIQGLII